MIPEIERLGRELARTGVSRKTVAAELVPPVDYRVVLAWCLGRKVPSVARREGIARYCDGLALMRDRAGLRRKGLRGRPRVFCVECGERMRGWRERSSETTCEACLVPAVRAEDNLEAPRPTILEREAAAVFRSGRR